MTRLLVTHYAPPRTDWLAVARLIAPDVALVLAIFALVGAALKVP